MKLDVSALYGRIFLSSSNNSCQFQKIEFGALRGTWKNPPSKKDMEEANEWIRDILGRKNLELFVCEGKANEKKALEEWRKLHENLPRT